MFAVKSNKANKTNSFVRFSGESRGVDLLLVLSGTENVNMSKWEKLENKICKKPKIRLGSKEKKWEERVKIIESNKRIVSDRNQMHMC